SPYSIALGVVLVLGLLEGLGILVGISLSTIVDNLSPIEMDIDASGDISSGGLSSIIGWLCLNRLPLMIWFVLFLTLFAVVGYTVNFATGSVIGYFLPGWLVFPAAVIGGMLLTGRLGFQLAKIMPKNETSAVYQESLEGRLAEITIGTAKVGSPAEASVTDDFEQKHYVMVEPIGNDEVFYQGSKVVLIEKGDSCWTATSLD
ncbi:MAG: YqiJ family protein, partial [Pseudomonadota bacterium]